MGTLIGIGVVLLVGSAVIAWLLVVAGSKRPEAGGDRDQIVAQLRTFAGLRPGPDDPLWDGEKRVPIPHDPGGGAT